MKLCLVALALLTVANSVTAGVVKPDEQPVLPPPASGLKQAILTVKKGIVQAYCWRKRLRIVITPPQYLDYYFDQTKTEKGEGYMPRSALQKSLIEALSPRDKDLAEQLAAIKKTFLRKIKKKIDEDKDRRVTKEEFIKYFLPVISDVTCTYGGGPSPQARTEQSDMYRNTVRIILRGFKTVYCGYKKKHSRSSVKAFLRGYFAKYQKENGYLPQSALRYKLRKALPRSSNRRLRKKLARLSSKFVAKLRKRIDQDNDKQISREEFEGFFGPKLSKKGLCREARRSRYLRRYKETVIVVSRGFARLYCRDKARNKRLTAKDFLASYFAKNKNRKDSLPKKGLRSILKQSLPRTAKHLRNRLARLRTKFINKLKREIDSNGDSSISESEFKRFFAPRLSKGVCRRERERRHRRRYVRTVRIIRSAFVRLYNYRRRSDHLLKPRTFLVNYFNEFKDQHNRLPRQALRTYLRKSLPNSARKLKKKLASLRTYYIKKLKYRIDIDRSGEISRKEFVKFLIEYLYRRRGNRRGPRPIRPVPTIRPVPIIEPVPTRGPVPIIEPVPTRGPVPIIEPVPTVIPVRPPIRPVRPCNMRRTRIVVRKGIQRLYCIMKKRGRVSGPRSFLKYFFKKYRNRRNSLPSRALYRLLRKALPKNATKLRKKLKSLRRRCVRILRRSIDRNGDGRVSRREFIRFYVGPLSRRGVCLRGGRGPPICPPGYIPPGWVWPGKRKCNIRRTTRVIKKGFAKLYCTKKRSQRRLTPRKFLIWYFKTFRTRNNSLPRSALRKSLRQSLPKQARRLRKKLNKLSAFCIRKMKLKVDKDGDFKISKKEFLKFFLPSLSKPGICRSGRKDGEETEENWRIPRKY